MGESPLGKSGWMTMRGWPNMSNASEFIQRLNTALPSEQDLVMAELDEGDVTCEVGEDDALLVVFALDGSEAKVRTIYGSNWSPWCIGIEVEA